METGRGRKNALGICCARVGGNRVSRDRVVGEYTSDEKTIKSLAYTELIAPLIKAIQELKIELDDLRARVGK